MIVGQFLNATILFHGFLFGLCFGARMISMILTDIQV